VREEEEDDQKDLMRVSIMDSGERNVCVPLAGGAVETHCAYADASAVLAHVAPLLSLFPSLITLFAAAACARPMSTSSPICFSIRMMISARLSPLIPADGAGDADLALVLVEDGLVDADMVVAVDDADDGGLDMSGSCCLLKPAATAECEGGRRILLPSSSFPFLRCHLFDRSRKYVNLLRPVVSNMAV